MRALALLLIAAPAFAHEGHGPAGPHMHGWDGTATLALVAAAGVAVWWFTKGRK
ncbi:MULTISPECIES: hypothetical protein [Roseateles]|uniref:Uncharacterized protein n=1 Tax=Pelomonas aquatica TaxID=431058 RepID=A0ABU1Z7G2_9BURK|nr:MULTISPECIES: hypothetical protein [Roseateles]MDR7295920.1 hypothetical protein [Pelomonas aquatica]